MIVEYPLNNDTRCLFLRCIRTDLTSSHLIGPSCRSWSLVVPSSEWDHVRRYEPCAQTRWLEPGA